MDRSLSAKDVVIQLLKFHLVRAQNRMTQQANKHQSDRTFAIGDMVYLKLQPYKQASVRHHSFHKLMPKFYGPYKVLDKIGHVAYQQDLHPNSNHQLPLPAVITDAFHAKETEAILERKMVKRGPVAATKVLVSWKGEATWEFYYDLLKKFPNFHT